jgi:hypothetical protein
VDTTGSSVHARASRVRAFAFRKALLTFAQHGSSGERAGEDRGKEIT